MIITDKTNRYVLDDNAGRIDRDAVWDFMANEAAWGKWRTRDIVDAQIDRSWRVVGAFERAGGRMVGFARAISDGISLAYLADVYVMAEHRGNGLGIALVKHMIDGGDGQHFRWMLHTNDAHGLYAKAGFLPPTHMYLERPGGPRVVPDVGSSLDADHEFALHEFALLEG